MPRQLEVHRFLRPFGGPHEPCRLQLTWPLGRSPVVLSAQGADERVLPLFTHGTSVEKLLKTS